MSQDIRDTGSVPTFYSDQVLEAERFYLDAVGGAGQPLAVVCGGRERCGPDYRIDRADFPFHSIEFVARGTGALRLKGRTMALYPGRIFTYGPGLAHVITTDAAEPLVKYFVDFTGPAAAKVLCDNDLAPGTAVRIASPDAVLRIFDDLIANGASGTRHGPAICAKLVELLVLKIAEAGLVDRPLSHRGLLHLPELPPVHPRPLRDAANPGRDRRGLPHRRGLPLPALQAVRQPKPLSIPHPAQDGQAARALQRNDALIKQVAFDLGFSDPFHFSRAFKKVFGLSPAAFRKLR
jgi:hypothetical protein